LNFCVTSSKTQCVGRKGKAGKRGTSGGKKKGNKREGSGVGRKRKGGKRTAEACQDGRKPSRMQTAVFVEVVEIRGLYWRLFYLFFTHMPFIYWQSDR